jgi:hypothetical protein
VLYQLPHLELLIFKDKRPVTVIATDIQVGFAIGFCPAAITGIFGPGRLLCRLTLIKIDVGISYDVLGNDVYGLHISGGL